MFLRLFSKNINAEIFYFSTNVCGRFWNLNFEILTGRKLCNSVSLYCSPSQSQDQFAAFSDNLEFNVD